MAKVFPSFLENGSHKATYPTHPQVARREETRSLVGRLLQFWLAGGENAGILSAGRLLKILIKLGLIFIIKFIHKGLKYQNLQLIIAI